MTDWLAIREACMGAAKRRGCSVDQAEDVAQETIARVLERAPDCAIGYALVVSDRLAVQVRIGDARMCELIDEPSREATQEAHVMAVQLGFIVRVRVSGSALEALDDLDGSAGRMRRQRARRAIAAALEVVR